VAQSLLDAIRELEARDTVLAAEIDELVKLEREIAELRERAAEVQRFLGELPERRARAEAELADAEAAVTNRLESVRAAEQEPSRAKNDDARAVVERAVATARESLATAEAHVARVHDDIDGLTRAAGAMEAEARELEDRARAAGARVGEEPEPGLAGIEPWGAAARAKVFAQRTHAEAERDRGIDEAAELGSAVTGESLAGAGVGMVRARIEAAMNRG
jgi:predicted  nucleic acid-binding Zn-ribbon protein